MFHIVLVEPQIPPNTGNIIRLCANCGASLHLVKPLGFEFSDRKLKRAGLDYHEYATVRLHNSIEEFTASIQPPHLYACSTKGTTLYTEARFAAGDALLFGSETCGLAANVLNSLPQQNVLRVPMQKSSRSLNLSNTVAIVVYEAWRQLSFTGSY
jgi:tRNA (cytidine/uridine-2'-O-)-methyltransferase